MKKCHLLYLLLLASSPSFLQAQGELDEQKSIILRDERTFGAFLNSNGLGLDYSYGRRINARNQTLFQAGFMSVKHPKEIKLSNNYLSSNTFVFGKQNSFFALKGQYGRMNEIYRKNDAGGISIRYFYTAGPVIGFTKPIYYDVYYFTGNPFDYFVKTEKFEPSIHQSNIAGRASFFKGFDEVGIIPGASAKFGFTFEYSRYNINVNAIEIGMGIDVYAKKVPIMATETNDFFFLNLFAGYRFGKVIDISEAARKKTWKERRKENQINKEIERKQKDAFSPSEDN
jgi:hypothetical protein